MSISSRASIRRFFARGFSAVDIAECLVSFDATSDAAEARRTMEASDFDLAGVRDGGLVTGYALRADLRDGAVGDAIRYFGSDQIIGEDAPLVDVVRMLEASTPIFVTVLGSANGIVARTDVEKIQMRLWLFAIISELEDLLVLVIRARRPGDSWHEDLSPARVRKAQELQRARARQGRAPDLVECLHFADKAHVAFRLEDLREQFDIPSRNAARQRMLEVEALRNALAHAHGFVDDHWLTVTWLAGALESLGTLSDRYRYEILK